MASTSRSTSWSKSRACRSSLPCTSRMVHSTSSCSAATRSISRWCPSTTHLFAVPPARTCPVLYDPPMAVSAYILIQTEVGKAAQVASEVGVIEGVVSAEDVTGPYDVIARAEANTVDELGKMVVSRVQMIDGITRTLTCPVVHL